MGLKFAKSNGLLNNRIYDFYIPNPKCGVDICKGATELCSKYCYGNGVFRHSDNLEKETLSTEIIARENYRISLTDLFVSEMNELIQSTKNIQRIRIHSIGDFYDYEYFLKWIKIMESNPNIQFTAYVKNFDVLIKYKATGKRVPLNFNLLLSFYPDTYDRYASQGGKGYVDNLFNELSTYYNASKYIVCSHQFFMKKINSADDNDFFCNGGTKMLCKKYNLNPKDYKSYFIPGQGCGDCLKCYSDEICPKGSNIYAVLRATSQLANLEKFLKEESQKKFRELRKMFPDEI